MTYAPPTLRDLGRYWSSHGGVNLGIVGDTRHVSKGRSYHLGVSQLTADAYSRKTARDRAGLTDAAAAIDLGKLNGSFPELRKFSVWLIGRCRTNASGTQDIREVIYTPDGKTVLRWDRERGVASEPRAGEADTTHLYHTHVSFYRDSEKRPKIGAFAPYFDKEAPVTDHNLAAIIKRTEYLGNEIASGDKEGQAVQAAKIIQYASRFLGGAEDLSDDPSVAIVQILTQIGLPPVFDGNAFIAAAPQAILDAANPLQNAQLTLLGLFGTPDDKATFPTADFSLYEQYHERVGGGWAPKAGIIAAWPEYAKTI